MLKTRTSRWVAGAAGVCAVLAAASWFLLVGPRLDTATRLHDEAAAAQAQNDTLALQIAQLKAQFADLPKKKAELAAVNREFPPMAEVPALLRKVNSLAGSSGVVVSSLTPGAAMYVTSTGAAGAAVAPAAGGTAAAVDPNALVTIPLSLNVSGDYFQTAQFMRQLQTGLNRAFLVTGLTVTQGSSQAGAETTGSTSGAATSSATSGEIGLEITGQIFALPDAGTAAATAATGAAGATGATGATGSAATGAATTTTNGGNN